MITMQRNRYLGSAALVLFLLAASAAVNAQAPSAIQADILIKNAHVVDGTGAPWYQADVAIAGDKIVYVGRAPVKAKQVIDAGGKVVAVAGLESVSSAEYLP